MIFNTEYPPATRGRIVVWGLLATSPFGGMTWQVLHHLAGFRRLGFDVWYVEEPGGMVLTPGSWESIYEPTADYTKTIEFVSHYMDSVRLGDRWIFRPPGESDTCFGARDLSGLGQLYEEADAVFHLCGSNYLRSEHEAIQRLVYLQTDPVAQQIAVAEGDQDVIEYLDAHDYLFTYGENLG
ncbi:hypothetical protein ACFL6S_37205, partial [Candidatus Poribacteria bacterium]